ncbi:MAG TPA: YlbF family regulator [Thermoanaerobacterium sp.]|nr:YlbF family regulator [Thermoanaerobacterium sp.]
MEVYDLAHQLARALNRSSEYNDFCSAKAKLWSNKQNVEMLQNFRRQQLEAELAALKGEQLDPSKKQRLEESYHILSFNPTIMAFLEAEGRLARLLADIQKILADALPEFTPGEMEPGEAVRKNEEEIG